MNRSHKIITWILKAIAVLAFAVSILSLFLPYVHRLRAYSDYPDMDTGLEFITIFIPFVLMAASVVFLFRNDTPDIVAACCLSILEGFSLQLVRSEIHANDFDHHYDTKAGVGFYLLFYSSVVLLVVSLLMIWIHLNPPEQKLKKQKSA
jgi:hypothetical protein